jgi:hypothetical protein
VENGITLCVPCHIKEHSNTYAGGDDGR